MLTRVYRHNARPSEVQLWAYPLYSITGSPIASILLLIAQKSIKTINQLGTCLSANSHAAEVFKALVA